jgi:hypothetical protein
MPKKLYSLDKEGKLILEVTWKRNFKNLELKLNNKPLGIIESREELIRGKTFEVSHNNLLSVKLVKELYLFSEIEILLNDQPVENSMTHPVRKLKDVFLVIMFISSINLIFGLLGLITDNRFFERIGAGFWNIIYAGIFVLLGLMIREKKSMFAMISIIVLMLLDIIATFLFMTEIPGHINPVTSVMVKLFLTLYLLRGVKAIKEFRNMEEEKEVLKKAEEEKMMKTPPSQQVTEDHSKFMPGDHSAYMPE